MTALRWPWRTHHVRIPVSAAPIRTRGLGAEDRPGLAAVGGLPHRREARALVGRVARGQREADVRVDEAEPVGVLLTGKCVHDHPGLAAVGRAVKADASTSE